MKKTVLIVIRVVCIVGFLVSFMSLNSRNDTANATASAPSTSLSITSRKLLSPL